MAYAFIGRDDDLARLRALVEEGATIVTIWGPPGIGKTRLARELLGRDPLLREGRPLAGRWFCDLTAARDRADLAAAVARTLGLPGSTPATDAWLGAALGARPPGLLVLDNFEQLAGGAAEVVGAWAASAPHWLFLVTSRERLRLAGEVIHELLPLGDEAVELFLEGVERASPRLAGRLPRERVEALVRRLEGIPLAIELAAARVDVLGLDDLLARMDAPLDVLAHAPRDFPAHHETLRRALDASFELLSPGERRAFVRSAVFRGGFSLEAAAAVLGDDLGAAPLDVLQSLRDKALLRRHGEGGSARLALFEALRAYAEETWPRLEEPAEVRTRHACHYLEGAGSLPPEDVGNLVEAATWALAHGRVAEALEALVAVDPALVGKAGEDLLRLALARAETVGIEVGPRARGEQALGRALQLRGRLAEARATLERGLDKATAARDDRLRGALLTDLGLVHHQQRDVAPARASYERALALHLQEGDEVAAARCLGNLGALFHDVRHDDEALEHYDRALAVFRARGERRFEGIFLTNKAVLLAERGAHDEARRCYDVALERLVALGERRLEGITRTNLGHLHQELGELERALACHEAALTAFREVTDPRSEGLCWGRLGMVLAALGRREEAMERFARAERILALLEDPLAPAVVRLFGAFGFLGEGEAGVREVRARLAEAYRPPLRGGASLVDLSDDARSAAKLLAAAVAGAAPAPSPGSRPPLIVGANVSWFTPPGGETQDLSRRRVLRRLLARLVDQHRATPGQGVTLDALRAAGWPGERLLHGAAINRVHVALAELRRRGLRDHLVRRDDRYLLDPTLSVQLAADRP